MPLAQLKFFALKALRVLLLLYVLLGAYGWFFADASIFLPPPPGYTPGSNIIFVSSVKGQKLAAIYYKNASAKYTILYQHGNASDIGYLDSLLKLFYQHGYSVFAYDYSGYGLSSGAPSESQTYKDATSVYDYMTNTLNIPSENIVIYGHSLGAAIATDLASRKPAAALILESPFVTAFRVRTKWTLYPFDKFSNISKLPLVTTPVLIMHSRDDAIIPFWHSQELYNRFTGEKQNYWLDHAGHNGIPYSGEAYWARLNTFVNKLSDQ